MDELGQTKYTIDAIASRHCTLVERQLSTSVWAIDGTVGATCTLPGLELIRRIESGQQSKFFRNPVLYNAYLFCIVRGAMDSDSSVSSVNSFSCESEYDSEDSACRTDKFESKTILRFWEQSDRNRNYKFYVNNIMTVVRFLKRCRGITFLVGDIWPVILKRENIFYSPWNTYHNLNETWPNQIIWCTHDWLVEHTQRVNSFDILPTRNVFEVDRVFMSPRKFYTGRRKCSFQTSFDYIVR